MMRRSLCLGLAVLLAVSGCGGGGSGDPASLEAMLGMVPDTRPHRQHLLYGNLARLRGDAAADDVEADVRALRAASSGAFVVASPLRERIHLPDWEQEAGVNLTDIDASLEAGRPPDALSVFTGRVDRARVDRALTGTAPFADQVRKGEHHGATTYAVGEDGAPPDANSVSLLRPVGSSLRIGVRDGTMWLASTDGGLQHALDSAAGEQPSLADDAGYAAVAGTLDGAGAFNAALVGDPAELTADAAGILGDRAQPELVAEVQAQIDAGILGLAPWEVAGLADAPGELLVVLSHRDDATAQENAERLRNVIEEGMSLADRAPWSERLSVTSIEVDGAMVVARLKAEAPMAYQILANRDTLITIVE